MTPDDMRKIATSPTLFNLDRMISPRIIKVLYLLGLSAIVIWSVAHLTTTFGKSFIEGFWGLIEIVVYGLLAFVVLRVACETLIIFFRKNASAMAEPKDERPIGSIFEDVKGALEELAEDDKPAEAPKAVVSEKPKKSGGSRSRAPRNPPSSDS